MKRTVKLIVIGVLGLAGLLLSAGYVQAMDQKTCLTEGYGWCPEKKTCATKSCLMGGKTFNPGDTVNVQTNRGTKVKMCDGCSGRMVDVTTSERERKSPGELVPPDSESGATKPVAPPRPPSQ